MDRRQRDIEQQFKDLGLGFELLRQRKHYVYRLTLPDGKTVQLVVSKSTSDGHRADQNRAKVLRKLMGEPA